MKDMTEKHAAVLDPQGVPSRSVDVSEGSTRQVPLKPFGVLSLIGMEYSISTTAITCVGSLATSLGGRGRIVFTWGLLLVFFMASGIACSLGELYPAMPPAGGQNYWASQFAPPKIRRGLYYLVGFLSWSGAVVTAASGTLALPQFALGTGVLVNPKVIVRPWMVFVGYQVTNVLIFCFNLFEKALSTLNLINLSIFMVTTLVIFVILLVTSSSKASGTEVFAKVDNVTGWPDGVAFILALVGPNWSFACLDAVTHIAEEIPNPRTNIPRVLIATVTLGISIGFPVMIGVMFCVTDFDSVVSTATGVPSLQLFYNSTHSIAGACVLQTMILVAFFSAVYSIHTGQSRVAWSFARDRSWPLSGFLSCLAPAPIGVPLMAHIWSCLWIAALGCVYLGSSLTFGAFVSGGILLQYLSYTICITLLLLHGRDRFNHGPFWVPRLGYAANIITIVWTLITLVFHCLPATYPTTPATMNYVSAVIIFMSLYAGSFWLISGRKTHKVD